MAQVFLRWLLHPTPEEAERIGQVVAFGGLAFAAAYAVLVLTGNADTPIGR